MFELAMVNEPSVYELLRFYCIFAKYEEKEVHSSIYFAVTPRIVRSDFRELIYA